MRVSVTKLRTFLRCRKKYHYSYIEKLQPKRKPVSMERGSIIHACLETHYKGGDWKATLELWKAEVDSKVLPFMSDKDAEEWATLPQEVYRIVNGFLRAFKAHDDKLIVLEVEKKGVVLLPSGHEFEYRIDRKVKEQDTGDKLVVDTKTSKTVADPALRFVDMQAIGYLWAEQQDTGEDIAGFLWEDVRTKPPTIPKLLTKGTGMTRDKRIDTDWATYRATLLANGLDPKDYEDMREALKGKVFYRRVKQAAPKKLVENVIREIDYTARQIAKVHETIDNGANPLFQRTILHDCHRTCPFAELCFTELAGQSAEWIKNERFEPRKSADELELVSEDEADGGDDD